MHSSVHANIEGNNNMLHQRLLWLYNMQQQSSKLGIIIYTIPLSIL